MNTETASKVAKVTRLRKPSACPDAPDTPGATARNTLSADSGPKTKTATAAKPATRYP